VCSNDAGGYTGGNVATGRVNRGGQVSVEEKVSYNEGVVRAPYKFAYLPMAAHPEIKAWSSRMGVGQETDKFILEK
jgi:hypothetical protein